jgi:drug/metabolite transporter (DMT)-like permease
MKTGSSGSIWLMISVIVVLATFGDVMIASALRQIGDLDEIRTKSGLSGAIRAVLTNVRFFFGVLGMAFSFFSLLYALSWADVSLVAPASAALTFVTNAVAARWILKENVDRRRWFAALCVGAGIFLLTR